MAAETKLADIEKQLKNMEKMTIAEFKKVYKILDKLAGAAGGRVHGERDIF